MSRRTYVESWLLSVELSVEYLLLYETLCAAELTYLLGIAST